MTNKIGWAAALSFVIATSALGVLVLGRMWSACDIGGSNSANVGVLLFIYGPGLLLAVVAVSVLTFTLTRRRGMLVRLVCAVAISILTLWAFFAIGHAPGDYPSPVCDDNIPGWWPNWIPL